MCDDQVHVYVLEVARAKKNSVSEFLREPWKEIKKNVVLGGSLEGKRVVDVACGDVHTIVLTEDGDLYSFGSGERGQHGQPGKKHQLAPKLVGPFVQASSMEILVPGEFKDGVVKCVSPKLDVKEEKSARVDVIFGPGSETQQGLSFMYYGNVTSTAMEPSLGAARGGWIARISGTGFRDVDSAVIRFRPDDASGNAFYASATYESETDSFLCKVPNISSEGFPGNVLVDVSLNGIDYEENDDTKEDDYEDEDEEKQGQRRIKILIYDDEIVRCVPYAIHFKEDTSTTLRLRGRGFPRSTRDRNMEVTVKLALRDQEYTTRGVVEGSTKVSCMLPKLTRGDLFGEGQNHGSVLTHVSMTFDGVNFSNAFPLYMYAGQLGTVEPSCGPITGGQTIRLKSSWFFPSEHIKVRFRGSSKSIVADGTYDDGDIICVMPKYPHSDTVSLSLSMDGSNFMSRTVSGSALKYTYFDVPSVRDVSFADDSTCRIEDAANEHVEMYVQGLDSGSSSSTGRIQLKVSRMFDDNEDEIVVKMVDPTKIQEEESEEDAVRHLISFSFPDFTTTRDEEEEEEESTQKERASTVSVTLYLVEYDYDVPCGDDVGVFRFDVVDQVDGDE